DTPSARLVCGAQHRHRQSVLELSQAIIQFKRSLPCARWNVTISRAYKCKAFIQLFLTNAALRAAL
ncbi:MAG: hypothetical protein J7551_03685, partial [Chloroflexi bacterium]|nr:hypothetical protein [Chloroflexota bacterium]